MENHLRLVTTPWWHLFGRLVEKLIDAWEPDGHRQVIRVASLSYGLLWVGRISLRWMNGWQHPLSSGFDYAVTMFTVPLIYGMCLLIAQNQGNIEEADSSNPLMAAGSRFPVAMFAIVIVLVHSFLFFVSLAALLKSSEWFRVVSMLWALSPLVAILAAIDDGKRKAKQEVNSLASPEVV